MKIAILGTGLVGSLIGSRLIKKSAQVRMGRRPANNGSGLTFVKNNPPRTASFGTFDAASRYADIIFNATNGRFALEALNLADTDFAEKIEIDVANPLDFTTNPPTLIPEFANTSSLGESIQSRYPKARVVKTLNMMGMALAVNPTQLNQGDHSLFLAGNDQAAKIQVKAILIEFGWKPDNVIDLGDIKAARGMESYLMLLPRIGMAFGVPVFNIKVVK